MKHMIKCWALIALACLPLACASRGFTGKPVGQSYYTQQSLRYDRGSYKTTNYQLGTLLPINTKVIFVAANSRRLKLTLPNGEQLLVDNMPRHTGQSMEQGFERLLGSQPVDLSQFSNDEQQAILSGTVEVRMSSKAVLAALGYPPITGTPNLEERTWKYWASRFKTFVIVFDEQWNVDDCPE
ncbi:MAG: hypothetical protein ACI9EF_003612 [Pseudohongiellaceae bacterium]|jgi:hypothetical protein